MIAEFCAKENGRLQQFTERRLLHRVFRRNWAELATGRSDRRLQGRGCWIINYWLSSLTIYIAWWLSLVISHFWLKQLQLTVHDGIYQVLPP